MVSSVPETPASNRITLYEHKSYTIEIEYNKDFIIIHLPRVEQFTKAVLIHMVSRLTDYSHFLKTAGYDAVYASVNTNNVRLKKLLSRLGFKRIGIHEDDDVYRKEL